MAAPLPDPTDRRTQSRRKHPRAPVSWPVTIISATGSCQGNAANISRGGALIHLSQQLTVGENVRLAFEVPDYQDVIVAKGEILRSFPLKSGDEQEYSYSAALQFTEISEENLKYFTGDMAPEWKADYRDAGPINRDIVPAKFSTKTPFLPWMLVFILLIPLGYLIYNSIQRTLDFENQISEIENQIVIIEKQIKSVQNSLDLFTPLEGQLKVLEGEVANIKTGLPGVVSLEEISQQINNQHHQIENINQKIRYFSEVNSKNSYDNPQEEQQYYIVRKGDNLFQISSRSKITIQELREINEIDPDEAIFPGQKIKIK